MSSVSDPEHIEQNPSDEPNDENQGLENWVFDKNRSNVHANDDDDESDDDDDSNDDGDNKLDTSWYPTVVDELQKLVTFYRLQILIFKKEQTKSEEFMKTLSMTHEKKHSLEWEVHEKDKIIHELQQQLSDTHILLYNEKNDNLCHSSTITQSNADLQHVLRENQHLLTLVQSQQHSYETNNSNHQPIRNKLQSHSKHSHKSRHRKVKQISSQTHHNTGNHGHQHQRLTTIYLPNDNSEALQIKLKAIEEEMRNFRNQCSEVNAYLMTEREQGNSLLAENANEYNVKFAGLQEELKEISTMHLFNIKEYLHYRRYANEKIKELKLQLKKQTYVMHKTHAKCKKTVHTHKKKHETHKKRIIKDHERHTNEFRKSNMFKDEELRNMNDKMARVTSEYDMQITTLRKQLKRHKSNHMKLHARRKLDKEGVHTDLRNLKVDVSKLSKLITDHALNDHSSYQVSLNQELSKIQHRLQKLAKEIA